MEEKGIENVFFFVIMYNCYYGVLFLLEGAFL